ncbi:hypothetical protein EFA69_04735 [Rufibacter immobilis]|uniref:DUF6799 domain-containing protein n=1 Tax=Rufibacter immobilis TaxID=1348778 RepID=A0A3M9N5N7_9BACT|nr:DUF6799 domain-containing protein [Rufibacter immobilis]RNI32627.1 hypothetical protein EFA69_04735 [Rufibacter immobilis]
MKRTLLYTCILLFAATLLPDHVLAQQTQDSVRHTANLKDNTIFWREGKLVHHKGGNVSELREPVQYSNGTVVSPNGQVRLANGKTYTLKQKNAVSPQGQIVLAADDIFTHTTIVDHEKQVVGDTETRINVIDGQIVSAGNQKQTYTYSLAQDRKIKLLEQLVKLMEQRTALLEANLTPAERRSIEAHHSGLDKQLSIINQQLQALPGASQ